MIMMDSQYFKRYRMQIRLDCGPLDAPQLPDGYSLVEWDRSDLERHAIAKFRSFRDEMDSEVFACLGEYYGCLRLMSEISHQEAFHAPATWMIRYDGSHKNHEDCGTIQGIIVNQELGSIQNVGVVPEHRGMGLGRALVLKSLEGFQRAMVSRVVLEVTANNVTAVSLYRSLGFQITRTMYRRSKIEEELP